MEELRPPVPRHRIRDTRFYERDLSLALVCILAGAGAGQGLTVNLPIQYGTSRKEQISRFRDATEKLADKMKPQLIMISAGFDSHAKDPIGSLDLESEDFTTLTEIMNDIARQFLISGDVQ